MRPRKSSYKQQLETRIAEAKQAAAQQEAAPAPAPAPDPAEGFTDPGIRAELLADQLSESRRELEAERQRRTQAESRAAKLEADAANAGSRAGLANVFRKSSRRAPWK